MQTVNLSEMIKMFGAANATPETDVRLMEGADFLSTFQQPLTQIELAPTSNADGSNYNLIRSFSSQAEDVVVSKIPVAVEHSQFTTAGATTPVESTGSTVPTNTQQFPAASIDQLIDQTSKSVVLVEPETDQLMEETFRPSQTPSTEPQTLDPETSILRDSAQLSPAYEPNDSKIADPIVSDAKTSTANEVTLRQALHPQAAPAQPLPVPVPVPVSHNETQFVDSDAKKPVQPITKTPIIQEDLSASQNAIPLAKATEIEHLPSAVLAAKTDLAPLNLTNTTEVKPSAPNANRFDGFATTQNISAELEIVLSSPIQSRAPTEAISSSAIPQSPATPGPIPLDASIDVKLSKPLTIDAPTAILPVAQSSADKIENRVVIPDFPTMKPMDLPAEILSKAAHAHQNSYQLFIKQPISDPHIQEAPRSAVSERVSPDFATPQKPAIPPVASSTPLSQGPTAYTLKQFNDLSQPVQPANAVTTHVVEMPTAKPDSQVASLPSPLPPQTPVLMGQLLAQQQSILASTSIADNQLAEPEAEMLLSSASTGALRDAPALKLAPEVQMPRQITHQIAEAARHLPNGPVEISLDPQELGRVRMSLNGQDGTMVVTLTVERAETAELLRRNMDSLAQDFHDIGYADVSFAFSGDGSNAHQNDPEQSHPNASQFGQSDTAEDTSPPAQLVLGSGIDIRL